MLKFVVESGHRYLDGNGFQTSAVTLFFFLTNRSKCSSAYLICAVLRLIVYTYHLHLLLLSLYLMMLSLSTLSIYVCIMYAVIISLLFSSLGWRYLALLTCHLSIILLQTYSLLTNKLCFSKCVLQAGALYSNICLMYSIKIALKKLSFKLLNYLRFSSLSHIAKFTLFICVSGITDGIKSTRK